MSIETNLVLSFQKCWLMLLVIGKYSFRDTHDIEIGPSVSAAFI